MSRGRTVVVVVAILALGGALAWHFRSGPGTPEKRPGGGAGAPVPVRLATAEQRDLPQLLEITGRTEAYETVALKARVEGQVQAVPFVDGQRVAAGDVLVQLDPADHQARLKQADANLARSQAQLVKARADVERYLSLKAKGFVSDEKVGEQRNALAAAEAVAQADAAAAELARLQLSYTTVRAPFAGAVGSRLVFPGSSVKANETALAVVNRVRPLFVSFSVPEKYLPFIRAGMGKDRRSKVVIALPGRSLRDVQGEVRFLDNAVDAATGTVQLKAVVGNADEQLASGQLVAVTLTLHTLKDAVVIPAEALQQGVDGFFVFAAKDDSVEVRKIRLAAQQKGLAAVAEGLKPGEQVVIEGQLRLTPGAKIRTGGDKPKPAQAAKPVPGPTDPPLRP